MQSRCHYPLGWVEREALRPCAGSTQVARQPQVHGQAASQSGRMGRGHRLRPAGEKGASWDSYAVVVGGAGRRRGVGSSCAPAFTHCSSAGLEGRRWRVDLKGRTTRTEVAADAPSALAPSREIR